MNRRAPRVSLAIPARNTRFFAPALRSALQQHYPQLEIIVCDDSVDGAIAAIVAAECAAAGGRDVRYVRNAAPLGFHGNFARCFSLAEGEYVKLLNDDDVLDPHCVARMVAAFETLGPRITLVSSRRRLIDATDDILPDTAATASLSSRDCTFDGMRFGDHLLVHGVNTIGEPSAAMFRRARVDVAGGTLFRIDGRDYTCLADVALWLRLLAQGSMAYLAQPLSRIRIHAEQLQRSDEVAAQCMAERVHLPRGARALGFLADEETFRAALRHGATLVHGGLRQPGLSAAARLILEAAAQAMAAPAPH